MFAWANFAIHTVGISCWRVFFSKWNNTKKYFSYFKDLKRFRVLNCISVHTVHLEGCETLKCCFTSLPQSLLKKNSTDQSHSMWMKSCCHHQCTPKHVQYHLWTNTTYTGLAGVWSPARPAYVLFWCCFWCWTVLVFSAGMWAVKLLEVNECL